MKKFDITTRQGRSRRRSSPDFNSNTLLPHSGDVLEDSRAKKRSKKAAKAAKWAEIMK